jgi:hypothetical protein
VWAGHVTRGGHNKSTQNLGKLQGWAHFVYLGFGGRIILNHVNALGLVRLWVP